jgi:putative acetyltransferase
MGLTAQYRRMNETGTLRLRRIRPEDDAALAAVIRATMTEFGATGAGHSINDPEVDHMSGAYADTRSAYWVLERDEGGRIVGGGGIGPLAGGDPGTCELRKMYFLPEARGRGMGRRIAEEALAFAKAAGYRTCYLETMQKMEGARALYEKLGFVRSATPKGHTGHFGCDAWYERDL